MVPAISSTSLPVTQAGERLPAAPAADAYARALVARDAIDPLAGDRSRTSALGERPSAAQARVEDANLPPRRRAGDSARAPGFPTSPFVAQLLAQEAFPPTATAAEDGLAAYHATVARGNSGGVSLSIYA